jgi:antitoxin component of MazEF toxin-antitoxin module
MRKKVEVELKEWGNSVGVILPREELRRLGLEKGDSVEIEISLKRRVNGFGIAGGAESFEEEKETHEEFW